MRALRTLLALALVAGIGGCNASSSTDGPGDVAHAFWTAAQNRDQAGAMQLATASESSSFHFDSEESTINHFVLGEMVMEDGRATVPTQMSTETPDQVFDMDFETVLVKADGKWLVDVEQTSNSLLHSMLGMSMEALGDAMAEGMQGAMEGLGEAMMEGMEGMAEGMAEAMEEVDGGK